MVRGTIGISDKDSPHLLCSAFSARAVGWPVLAWNGARGASARSSPEVLSPRVPPQSWVVCPPCPSPVLCAEGGGEGLGLGVGD